MTQTISKFFKDAYWISPFIFFLAGYQCVNFFFYHSTLQAPQLVGKTVPQALQVLAQYNLNMRMIAEQEDPDVPAGTIISQTPKAQSSIRPQQTIFLVISKQPKRPLVPNVYKQPEKEYTKKLSELKIRYKTFPLASSYPKGTCLAQIPQPGAELPKSGIILYTAQDNTRSLLFPSFKNKSVKDVEAFLKKYNLSVRVYHTHTVDTSHSCRHCKVLEQKPLAGSFVSLDKPFSVQLKV